MKKNPTSLTLEKAALKRVRMIQQNDSISKSSISKALDRYVGDLKKAWKRRADAYAAKRKYSEEVLKDLGEEFFKARRAKASLRLREFEEKRQKRSLQPPTARAVQPRITGGSVISVLVPPYWGISAYTNGNPTASPNADAIKGTFGGTAYGPANGTGLTAGGTSTAYAGVAALYQPISDLPVGHFRPFLKYSYLYADNSDAYTAHSNGWLQATVFEVNSAGVIVNFPPDETSITVWQDGTSWYNSDTDEVNDRWAGVIDLPFQITRGYSYLLLASCTVDADYAGNQLLGDSSAQAWMSVTCPFMVVEEANI